MHGHEERQPVRAELGGDDPGDLRAGMREQRVLRAGVGRGWGGRGYRRAALRGAGAAVGAEVLMRGAVRGGIEVRESGCHAWGRTTNSVHGSVSHATTGPRSYACRAITSMPCLCQQRPCPSHVVSLYTRSGPSTRVVSFFLWSEDRCRGGGLWPAAAHDGHDRVVEALLDLIRGNPAAHRQGAEAL